MASFTSKLNWQQMRAVCWIYWYMSSVWFNYLNASNQCTIIYWEFGFCQLLFRVNGIIWHLVAKFNKVEIVLELCAWVVSKVGTSTNITHRQASNSRCPSNQHNRETCQGGCRDPVVPLLLPILLGKRDIFTCSPLLWYFCPLSFTLSCT